MRLFVWDIKYKRNESATIFSIMKNATIPVFIKRNKCDFTSVSKEMYTVWDIIVICFFVPIDSSITSSNANILILVIYIYTKQYYYFTMALTFISDTLLQKIFMLLENSMVGNPIFYVSISYTNKLTRRKVLTLSWAYYSIHDKK